MLSSLDERLDVGDRSIDDLARLIFHSLNEDGLPAYYESLFDSMGYRTLVKVDQDDYQGDSLVLFYGHGLYGFLQFGWGSCSGCDALQAAYDDLKALEELRLELWRDIRWGTRDEMLAFLKTHDWEGDHLNGKLTSDFVAAATTQLAGRDG